MSVVDPVLVIFRLLRDQHAQNAIPGALGEAEVVVNAIRTDPALRAALGIIVDLDARHPKGPPS